MQAFDLNQRTLHRWLVIRRAKSLLLDRLHLLHQMLLVLQEVLRLLEILWLVNLIHGRLSMHDATFPSLYANTEVHTSATTSSERLIRIIEVDLFQILAERHSSSLSLVWPSRGASKHIAAR